MYRFFTYFWHLKITNRAFKKFPGPHYFTLLSLTLNKSYLKNSHIADFEQVKIKNINLADFDQVISHFANFEQVKKLVVILLLWTSQKLIYWLLASQNN